MLDDCYLLPTVLFFLFGCVFVVVVVAVVVVVVFCFVFFVRVKLKTLEVTYYQKFLQAKND